jgi:ankyrin repeat protein
MFKLSSRFRWIFCQLETLRHCLPPSVRRTLDELPESLDETYERVLREIKKPNRDHARCLLQCLVVAIRPLRVDELAEVLAVDFDDEGIPKLKLNWRWEDQEQALLSSCSSLIAIVESIGSRVVQFSHFSVKEFLTSSRLATSSGDTSRYHIAVEPAHTTLAQACLSVLLRLDDRVEQSDVRGSFPLAGYAAEHWVAHAQDERVLSCVRKAMEYLFDVNKPYFGAWLQLHDIDTRPEYRTALFDFTHRSKSGATPLYYAAFCGFRDLVEHLTVNDPKQVHATGGLYVTPLVAALGNGHFRTAKFLIDNGSDPNVRGYYNMTPLLSAAYNGDFEMVQLLLKYKADINARDDGGENALHNASHGSSPDIGPSLSNIARLLLKHGADVNERTGKDMGHSTPLHLAAQYGRIEVAHVLLQHGADVGTKDGNGSLDGSTALHQAAESGNVEVVRMLLQHGADVGTKDGNGRTALHHAVECWKVEVVRMLLQHGADVGMEDSSGATALQLASDEGHDEIMKLLSEHRAG